MSTMLGSASRAREIATLFEVWRRAFDLQDAEMMAVARRAIDSAVVGTAPLASDMRAIKRFVSHKILRN